MVAAAINGGNDLTKKINILCLIAAIAIVLILPFKKEIWYDETVSMLCSKGISHDTPAEFEGAASINSAQIEQLNTPANVFKATVNDNANSFLYNYALHWSTYMFGNSVAMYMLLTKLCAIATLIAFYALSRLLLKDSIFTGIAVILMAGDLNFISMSHEIRAYAMGTMFITLGAFWFYKFLLLERPVSLFLTALCSACAIMSHFLTVYIILVFLGVLLFTKGKSLFTAKNIIAVILPVSGLGVFLYFSLPGLNIMTSQSKTIEEVYAHVEYSPWGVVSRSMKYLAINYKAVLPAFRESIMTIIVSFLFIPILYYIGILASVTKTEKRNLHTSFILGSSSSVFLMFLSLKSGHYTPLYFRYFSFGLPFSNLFIACLLYTCYNSPRVNVLIKHGLSVVLIIPAFLFFAQGVLKESRLLKYNHPAIAGSIVKNNIHKVGIPDWHDAVLLHTLLPQGYKIDYFRTADGPYYTLYGPTGIEKIPVIKD